MRRIILCLLVALAGGTLMAAAQNSEDDYDESIRRPIRRLHPERERERARQKLQQEIDAKNRTKQLSDSLAWDTVTVTKSKKDNRRVVGTAPAAASTADKSQLAELLSHDYSLVEYVPPKPEPPRWKDDAITEGKGQLLAQLNKMEQHGGTIRYMPRDVAWSMRENAFFAYFSTESARISPLRIRVQYYADDPLNFNDVQFTIDGFDFHFHFNNPRRGKDTGRMIWEEADQVLSAHDKDLIYALAHASWVRMSLVGADGTKHVKMLTEKQIRDFYYVLQLFRLMGGVID